MKNTLQMCLLGLGVISCWGQIGHANEGSTPAAEAVTQITDQLQAVEDSIPTADDIAGSTPNLCASSSGFMVSCEQVEIVNAASDGYRAGFEDGLAGRDMGTNMAGASGSYARGFAEGLSLRTGQLMEVSGDAEKAEIFNKALEQIPVEQRPAFRNKFRSLIDYQNGVAERSREQGSN